MFCTKCGNPIGEDYDFCPICGMGVSKYESDNTVSKLKSFAVRFLTAAGIILILVGAFVILARCGIIKGRILASQQKWEGNGYESPRKAALAYADALAKWDYDKLISSCAIETAADNRNVEKTFEKSGMYYSYNAKDLFSLAKDNIGKRNLEDSLVKEANNRMYYQYLVLRGFDMKLLYINPPKIGHGGYINSYEGSENYRYENAKEYIDAVKTNSEPIEDLKIKIKGAEEISPEFISAFEDIEKERLSVLWEALGFDNQSEAFFPTIDEKREEIRKVYVDSWGAQDYNDECVRMNVDGKEFLMILDTVKYNGKWYVSTQDRTMSLFRIPSYWGSLICEESLNDHTHQGAMMMYSIREDVD